ncbi:serine/threonine protein phosphatase [Enterococcus faecalis]|uniref:metallophosphoesterase n=1 Tax=Enterococcus TaxID=1350 RepID=UPI00044EF80F|nr:metallophosphoesterase [Enterococcus faecalis]EGO9794986.1 serine/threonine protein phosphatase [Enterococcus faecalis]EKA3598258.1 metallophosphoesterase [Enterococcus faecalis]ETU56609.1 hypothetical protein P024_02270 [Enterococcus faecalis EnGen0424]NSN18496.1 metallophosphoesterase [Enterococcus faecalis]NSU88736.1 metallophosphoesterase [Enterococcus faecalis]
MKTLLVGDLHLKARLMLPIIERKTYELKCKRIIFIGDYVDDYFQEFNVELFINDLNYLLNWKRKMESKGINCIFLLGNHDAAYLTNQPRAYSLQDKNFFIKTRNLLFELELQVAFRLDYYLVSHAGYCEGIEPEEWHFDKINREYISRIDELEKNVGISRGGSMFLGSPIWADFTRDLLVYPNPNYLCQIVGHTPVNKIELTNNLNLIGIDTFNIHPTKVVTNIAFSGDGDLLAYDDGMLEVIPTNWISADTLNQFINYRIY